MSRLGTRLDVVVVVMASSEALPSSISPHRCSTVSVFQFQFPCISVSVSVFLDSVSAALRRFSDAVSDAIRRHIVRGRRTSRARGPLSLVVVLVLPTALPLGSHHRSSRGLSLHGCSRGGCSRPSSPRSHRRTRRRMRRADA